MPIPLMQFLAQTAVSPEMFSGWGTSTPPPDASPSANVPNVFDISQFAGGAPGANPFNYGNMPNWFSQTYDPFQYSVPQGTTGGNIASEAVSVTGPPGPQYPGGQFDPSAYYGISTPVLQATGAPGGGGGPGGGGAPGGGGVPNLNVQWPGGNVGGVPMDTAWDNFINAITGPGYSSPDYLASIGYVPGAGGTMWPGSLIPAGASPSAFQFGVLGGGGFGNQATSGGNLGNMGSALGALYLRHLMKGDYTTPQEWGQMQGLWGGTAPGLRPIPGQTGPLNFTQNRALEQYWGDIFRNRGYIFFPSTGRGDGRVPGGGERTPHGAPTAAA